MKNLCVTLNYRTEQTASERTLASVSSEMSVHCTSGVPRNFVWGVEQIQLRIEDRENGDLGGGSPLVRGCGCGCNLVQEISFHIVKFF